MIVSLPAGSDITPLLRGLPDDVCPCPHWGYVLKGRIRVTYADRPQVLRVGDLFPLPPGHRILVEGDTEFLEFTRPTEHQPVLDHIARVAAGAAWPSGTRRSRPAGQVSAPRLGRSDAGPQTGPRPDQRDQVRPNGPRRVGSGTVVAARAGAHATGVD